MARLICHLLLVAVVGANYFTFDPLDGVKDAKERLKQLELIEKHAPSLTALLSRIQPANIMMTAAPDNSSVSTICRNRTNLIGSSLSELWAQRILDAWAKAPPGILTGHTAWVGEYDECLNQTYSGPIDHFGAQYCNGGFGTYIEGKLLTFGYDVCMPRGCTVDDVTALVNEYLHRYPLPVPIGFQASICRTNERPDMSTGNIATVVVLSIIIGLCVLATIMEGIFTLIESYRNEQPGYVKLEPTQTTKGLGVQTLMCFSLYHNGWKLLATKQGPGTIRCLNGIRFISMTWVILGHSVLFAQYTLANITFTQTLASRWTSQILLNATVSVDTFFVLSGLLIVYLTLKEFHRRNISLTDFFKSIPVMYLHRYLRLTPAYAVLILIWTNIMYFLWTGPMWPIDTTIDGTCSDRWYTAILYVNNIFDIDGKLCVGWGWYLSNDFQFFLIAPFIIYLLYKYERFGLFILTVSILGSIGAAITLSDLQGVGIGVGVGIHSDIIPRNITGRAQGEYFAPWSRFQSYGVGMFAGYLVWKLQLKRVKIPTFLNLLLWGLSAGICLSYLYAPYDAYTEHGHTIHQFESDLYNGIGRSAWSIGVSYVIIACTLGQGGWVNEFLSWPGFVPLSRMTYAAYLIHIPIMFFFGFGARQKRVYTDLVIIEHFLGILFLAYLGAFAFSLLFEAPFIGLDRIFFSLFSVQRRHEDDPPESKKAALSVEETSPLLTSPPSPPTHVHFTPSTTSYHRHPPSGSYKEQADLLKN